MKRLLLIAFAALGTYVSLCAQDSKNSWKVEMPKHLDFSLSAGTTGIGFDFSAPLNDKIRVRMGADFMPKFTKTMNFGVEVGEDDPNLTPEENAAMKDEHFNNLSMMLESFTGLKVNNSIDMIGEPSLNTFKLLVDVFPFKNKNWHVTAGFYLGGTKVGKAYNTTEDMTSLMSVAIYNSMYKRAVAEEPLITYEDFGVYLPPNITDQIRAYGTMAIGMGTVKEDIIAQQDIFWDHSVTDPITGEYIHQKGDLLCAKGDVLYHAGDEYRMIPDEDNMVKATAKANAFRPYLGFGYGTKLSKKSNTSVSFDAGLMFWGGAPDIMIRNYEGLDADGNNVYSEVNMCKDLTNLHGKVGTTIDLVKSVKVYPVISLRLTQVLF